MIIVNLVTIYSLKPNTILSSHKLMQIMAANKLYVHSYNKDAKQILQNVFQFCRKEKQEGLLVPLDRVADRTATMTGVSRATVYRVSRQQSETAPTTDTRLQERVARVHLDDFDQGVVRRTINNMYSLKKTLPTLKNIHLELKVTHNLNTACLNTIIFVCTCTY